MGDEPVREIWPLSVAFDEPNLERAREALTRAQGQDLAAGRRAATRDGHRVPCFHARTVEWLFGYIDRLAATLATERAEGERLRGFVTSVAQQIEPPPWDSLRQIAVDLLARLDQGGTANV